MGLMTLVEDRPTPKCVYNWKLYISALIASFASVMIGYDSAFIGGTLALPSFKDEFGIEKISDAKWNFEDANIVSCYQAGAFFGAFMGYIFGQLLGRKFGLVASAICFSVGAALQTATSHHTGLGILYAGRIIAGLGVGAASNLTPIYVAEIAPPSIRGRLVGIYEFGWQIGGLVGFWIPYGVQTRMTPSHKQWIIPFALQLVPGGILLFGALWIHESPRWLLDRGRREEAIANLEWFRKLNASENYMIEEIHSMDVAHEEQVRTIGTGFFAPFKALFSSKALMQRIALGVSLFAWQNGSGINAINYYSPTVFKTIGVTGTNSTLFSTGIFGVIKTLATIVWLLFLVDKVGRRSMMIIGGIGGGICMYAIGAYIKIADPAAHPTTHLGGGGIAGMFFLYLWVCFYSPSWNGTPWVINAEVFDQNVRTLTQAFAAASNWLFNFLIARFTPQMFAKMGYGVFIFFATLMVLSAVYVFFLVPETKGIPLEDIDNLFTLPPRKAHQIVLAQVHVRNGVADKHFTGDVEDLPEGIRKMSVTQEVAQEYRKGSTHNVEKV